MSKTIGLITLHTVSNYGSCLQAYATQKVFEKLGWEALVIDYYREDNLPKNDVERAFNGRRLSKYRGLFERAPFLKSLLSVPLTFIVKRQRRPFDSFRDRYLNLTKDRYETADSLLENPPEADVYCTGSDQVWNSIWNRGFEEPFYLSFVPEGKRKIAYSASIGRESVDDWEKPLMRDRLSSYQAISMREQSGIRVLEDLGFDDVSLVLDPTLMLGRDDWVEIASYREVPEGDYILVYQLNKSQDFVTYVDALSRKHSIPVVKISYGVYDIQKGARNVVAPSVNDFLGLFLKASFVVTDSFHATSFALNFRKPFVSIAPERFSTRIANILEVTGTEDRMLSSYTDYSLYEAPVDFDAAESRLNRQREKSFKYLRGALEGSE